MFMLSDPIQINSVKDFGPKFFESPNNYDIMFQVCDHSDNCSGTRWCHFGSEENNELKRLEFGYASTLNNFSLPNSNIYKFSF
jgi:hypothetical protein